MIIKTLNLDHKSMTKMMLGLARLSVWWMNEWKWTMMRVQRSVKQTDNKSKVLKWTRFLKTTKEEVSNNYIVVQLKRKKKYNNDVVVETIVTVY